jgi:hypothetical protein
VHVLNKTTVRELNSKVKDDVRPRMGMLDGNAHLLCMRLAGMVHILIEERNLQSLTCFSFNFIFFTETYQGQALRVLASLEALTCLREKEWRPP